jgi:hypothetical protein
MTPATFLEHPMANNPQNDLRKGKPQVEPSTSAKLAGHQDRVMPMPKSGEHAVNPGSGSKAGVGEGQGTKSN